MSDEVYDLTSLVKIFEMNMETSIITKELSETDKQFCVYCFTPPKQHIDFVISDARILSDNIKTSGMGKTTMTYNGKYWFDKKFTCDIVMKNIVINGDQCTAEYEGMNVIDLINYSILARFLRWILKRQNV